MKNKLILIALFFNLVCCSCQSVKYRKQFDLIHTLLIYLSHNDTTSVRRIIGLKLDVIGKNEHMLAFDERQVSELIQKFGMPKESKYVIKEYPPNDPRLLDVTIPIFKGKSGSLSEASITVYLVKYLPDNKIVYFDVYQDYDDGGLIKPVDSLKVNH